MSSNNSIRIQFYSDGSVQGKGFVASWVALPKDETVIEGHLVNENAPGYVLSFPQSFTRENSGAPKESICLQLINVQEDGEAEISFFNAENVFSGVPSLIISYKPLISYKPEQKDKLECFQVQLPDNFNENTAWLRINGTFGSYKIHAYKQIAIIKKSFTISLIQTDKYDYRPKQDVKFRIMVLDADLKPSKQVYEIYEAWIPTQKITY